MDYQPHNIGASDKVEHWLASTMEVVELMKHERAGEETPSTSSSSPVRPRPWRDHRLAAAATLSRAKGSSDPRFSQRGSRNRGRGRGRGKTVSSFHDVLSSTNMPMTVAGTSQLAKRSITQADPTIALPHHLKKAQQEFSQPLIPSRQGKPTGIPGKGHVPITPHPARQGSVGSSLVSQIINPFPSIAPQNPFELAIDVFNLPRCYTTWMVYQLFEKYGNIDYIRIDRLRLKTRVVFKPAPRDVSWVRRDIPGAYPDIGSDEWKNRRKETKFLCKALEFIKPLRLHKSPRGNNTFPVQIVLPLATIDFGTMKTESTMMIMNSVSGPTDKIATFTLDLSKLRVLLTFEIRMPATPNTLAANRTFMVQLDIAQMHEMIIAHGANGYVSLIITVDNPPEIYRKADDIEETHEDCSDEWNQYLAWYRQTDIDTQPVGRNSPVSLRKTNCILDTGRWLTYRVKFGPSAAASHSFTQICQALADHNVCADTKKNVEYSQGDMGTSWAWLDTLQQSQHDRNPDSLLSGLLEMTSTIHLTFPVHYQLEVCLSLGVLHEYNIDVRFLTRLAALDPHRAVKILEKVADRRERVYDLEDVFRLHDQVSAVEKRRPGYCAKIPAATVTPTSIYFSTPVLETSNRVVRHFAQYEDRFMRVKFNDEKHKGGLHSQDNGITREIFSRVFRTMTHGIIVGGRRYEFLAFGSSQFRDHGAYFFASTDTLSAAAIRGWMGDFSGFNNVAKYISHLGLCFTTTRGIPHRVSVQRIDDVDRNRYHFTDGVGKISPLLADMIASHYKFDYRPSVFQFRMAGCKGVLAVDPDAKGMSVQIRPSQDKFPAPFHGLEIAKTSKFTSANLNVQLILVLSALGVPDGVFMGKLLIMMADMEKAMTDEFTARRLLEKNIDYNQMTLSLSQAVGDGFMETQEPFIISWLHLWRSWSLKYLQQKQRILIEQGAYVFGVTDETATLRGHFNDGGRALDEEGQGKGTSPSAKPEHKLEVATSEKSVAAKTSNVGHETTGDQKSNVAGESDRDQPPSLPEIFIQVPNPDAKGGYSVIEAICIITRSPTLHPGDVRVVRAVNVPALLHLKDCVVLPQTGDRDLASMCSGGDLDGDEYVVSWDPALIPHESLWNEPAMDFSTDKPPPRDGPVTVDDMASFFVNHIKNDKLGQIAVAHKCWADWEHDGVRNEKCIELAELHSQAVDYPKTGMPAEFPKRLRLKQRPHWAEPRGKDYISKKVIGQLYDAVKLDKFKPAWELPFDQRILNASVPSQQNLEDAKEVKNHYDEAMRRIMAQYGIKNEFEVFTTFVQDHSPDLNDYKFTETIDEVSSNLRVQFMEQCYEKAGTTVNERNWEKMKPFIVAMYTITAQEVGDAVADSKQIVERGRCWRPRRVLGFENVPFMSFPWIFGRDLANIAKGRNGGTSLGFQTAKAKPTLPTAKRLTKAQDMAEHYGELEPLAEVYMPEGAVLHAGDVMNLHHGKIEAARGMGGDGIMPLNHLQPPLPSEDIAATLNLLSSMKHGDLGKSAKPMCEERDKEVSFETPGATEDATQLLLLARNAVESITSSEKHELADVVGKSGETMKRLAIGNDVPPYKDIADTTSQLAVVDTDGSGIAVDQQPLTHGKGNTGDANQPDAAETASVEIVSREESEAEEEAEEEEEVEIIFDDIPSSMLEV